MQQARQHNEVEEYGEEMLENPVELMTQSEGDISGLMSS